MEQNNKNMLENNNNSNEKNKKTYPYLAFMLLIFSILFLGLSICLLFVENFIKVSLTIAIISSLLFIISHNLNRSLNGFYFITLMILIIYALVSTYAFSNEDLIFHGFILIFCFNLIYIIGKIFDLRKKRNKPTTVVSCILLPILFVSNIVLFSLYTILGYMITTLCMISLNIIFLLYDISYEYIFFIKHDDKKSEE